MLKKSTYCKHGCGFFTCGYGNNTRAVMANHYKLCKENPDNQKQESDGRQTTLIFSGMVHIHIAELVEQLGYNSKAVIPMAEKGLISIADAQKVIRYIDEITVIYQKITELVGTSELQTADYPDKIAPGVMLDTFYNHPR